MATKRIKVDGEELLVEGNVMVDTASVLSVAGITEPDRYDLIAVGLPGTGRVMPKAFAPTDGMDFITARKSATSA
jgi:hypothetical protein